MIIESAFETALNRDNADRDALVAKQKLAPDKIETREQAAEAWRRFNEYRGKADFAYTRYMQAGIGTQTQRKYHVRYEAFSDVTDGWERALDGWFRAAH